MRHVLISEVSEMDNNEFRFCCQLLDGEETKSTYATTLEVATRIARNFLAPEYLQISQKEPDFIPGLL